MRLLLIGPYPPLARALRRGLEEEGFAVEVVPDPDEGGIRARAAAYDVVVIDVPPHGKQGLEVLRDWRGSGLTTPVLLLGHSGTEADMPDGRPAGPYDALGKPFQMEELLARLWALLDPAHRNGA